MCHLCITVTKYCKALFKINYNNQCLAIFNGEIKTVSRITKIISGLPVCTRQVQLREYYVPI